MSRKKDDHQEIEIADFSAWPANVTCEKRHLYGPGMLEYMAIPAVRRALVYAIASNIQQIPGKSYKNDDGHWEKRYDLHVGAQAWLGVAMIFGCKTDITGYKTYPAATLRLFSDKETRKSWFEEVRCNVYEVESLLIHCESGEMIHRALGIVSSDEKGGMKESSSIALAQTRGRTRVCRDYFSFVLTNLQKDLSMIDDRFTVISGTPIEEMMAVDDVDTRGVDGGQVRNISHGGRRDGEQGEGRRGQPPSASPGKSSPDREKLSSLIRSFAGVVCASPPATDAVKAFTWGFMPFFKRECGVEPFKKSAELDDKQIASILDVLRRRSESKDSIAFMRSVWASACARYPDVAEEKRIEAFMKENWGRLSERHGVSPGVNWVTLGEDVLSQMAKTVGGDS